MVLHLEQYTKICCSYHDYLSCYGSAVPILHLMLGKIFIYLCVFFAVALVVVFNCVSYSNTHKTRILHIGGRDVVALNEFEIRTLNRTIITISYLN